MSETEQSLGSWIAATATGGPVEVVALAVDTFPGAMVEQLEHQSLAKKRSIEDCELAAQALFAAVRSHASSAPRGDHRYTFELRSDGSLVSTRHHRSPGSVAADEYDPRAHAAELRHIEEMSRITAKGVHATLASLIKSQELSERELARYREQHLRTVELLQELLDRSSDREIAKQSQARSDARKDKALQAVAQVIPAIVARLQGAGPAATILRQLSPEDFEGILMKLDAEGQEAVRALLTSAQGAEAAQGKLLELVKP